MPKQKHPIFIKSLFGLAFCFATSIFLFYRAVKPKAKFDSLIGVIMYIETSSPFAAAKNSGKYRYIKLDNYTRPFELFIGKDWDDFTPKYERLDELRAGDTIKVYYDESLSTENGPVNRLAYFIDKGTKPVFIKGSWEKGFAFFLAGFSVLMTAILIVLKRKGKII